MQEAAQLFVSGRVVSSVHGRVILAEGFRPLPLGKIPQDHHRIAGILNRLRGHMT